VRNPTRRCVQAPIRADGAGGHARLPRAGCTRRHAGALRVRCIGDPGAGDVAGCLGQTDQLMFGLEIGLLHENRLDTQHGWIRWSSHSYAGSQCITRMGGRRGY